MDRLLIVPAAGRGSRLGSPLPKALVPVAGQPMLAHLLTMHRATTGRAVVVVAPAAVQAVTDFASDCRMPVDIVVQESPTGMLDAIVLATPLVASLAPRRVAITWCDQIALSRETIDAVAQRALGRASAPLILPTLVVDQPYIHFDRDRAGRIVGVRQRREGDVMPERGETDMGLFDLSCDAFLRDLAEFSRHAAGDSGTGERNFLPFIPWLAGRARVDTVAGQSRIETIGVNTPEELATIEAHMRTASPPS